MDDDENTVPLLEPHDDKSKDKVGFPSCRHVLAFSAFLGFVNVYALRVNLSVALVAMVNSSHIVTKNYSNECPTDNSSGPSDLQEGEFNWDGKLQGLVLGSFFYGYIVTQVPGGFLAQKFGGKLLFGLGVLCTAVLTLITPLAARASVYFLIAVRVVEGIGEGVTFPAFHAILAKWSPLHERSKLGAFVYAGAQFGTVISLPASGLLCAYGFAGGWPSVFYVFGSIGCLWFIFWMCFAFNSPSEHPRISETEKRLIETSIGHAGDERLPTPWLEIFTSVPFYATLVGHFCNNWGFYTLLTCLPTYMKEVLGFRISDNGFVSAIPYVACWLLMTASGQIADFLRHNGYMSTTNVRKLMLTVGLGIPAILLVALGYVKCDKVLAVALLTAAVGISGFGMSGYGVNHLDLAPPFAGTLMGLTNGFATIPGFAGPQVVGLLTNDSPTRERWQIVFYISAAINVFGAIFYLIFGSGVEQRWSKAEYLESKGYKIPNRRGLLYDEDDPRPQVQAQDDDFPTM